MISSGKRLKLFAKDERGAVLILVALSMMVLMGMTALAIDGGYLYQARRDMVNAADAAALAGAQELSKTGNPKDSSNWGAVEIYAEQYAIDNYDCDPAQVRAEVRNFYTVEVETGKTVDFTFARVLGFVQSDVPARAVAVYNPVFYPADFIPFGVSIYEYDENGNYVLDDDGNKVEAVFEFGEEFILHFDNHQDGHIGAGNFHVLSLDKSGFGGPGGVGDVIKNGYKGEDIGIYDWVDTDPGGTWVPTAKAVNDRIDEHGCLAVVPLFGEILQKPNSNDYKPGSTEVMIYGFAVVCLERPIQGEKIIRATYVGPYTVAGEGDGLEGFDGAIDFGAYVVKLIKWGE